MQLSDDYRNYTYSREDYQILEQYKSFVDALGQLFGSACEVVLHSFEDLNSSVIYIHNGELTGRGLGSPVTDKALQILQECERSSESKSGVYFTRNKNNHLMRSTSTIIKNGSGHAIGMLCINFDVSVPLDSLFKILLPQEASQSPEHHGDSENFAIDVDDLITSQTLKVKAQVFADTSIPMRQKIKEVVAVLKEQGIFKLREAVCKVAASLNVSKDVVYLHLRQLKKQEQGLEAEKKREQDVQ